jgi:hypothetical protein
MVPDGKRLTLKVILAYPRGRPLRPASGESGGRNPLLV